MKCSIRAVRVLMSTTTRGTHPLRIEPLHDEVMTFATTTSALLELNEWLSSYAVTHVAMEATGVYWKPVWHLLEGDFELILANAQHIRNVPGRKTDVSDAGWIADLLAQD